MGRSPEAASPGSEINRLGPWAIYDPAMPVEARIASIAAVAGTATNLGGGKSANGAVSGSYWRLYSAAETVHTYKVGPTRMCYTDQPGCTLPNALEATRPVSVPFTNSPVEGYMEIGPNNDPIEHFVDRENFTITNIALEGHPYAGGQVVHRLEVHKGVSLSWNHGFHMRESIRLTTVGSGPNSSRCCGLSSAFGNELIGSILFYGTHVRAQQLMQRYLGGR